MESSISEFGQSIFAYRGVIEKSKQNDSVDLFESLLNNMSTLLGHFVSSPR